MYTLEEKLILWAHMAAQANPALVEQLRKGFQSLEEAFSNAKRKNVSVFSRWNAPFVKRMMDTASNAFLDDQLAFLAQKEIHFAALCSEGYPKLLKEIRHPPAILYIKGNIEAVPTLPFAIVGMRKSSAYGEGVARHLSAELVKHGAIIISGMALGIDSCAAKGALSVEKSKLPTIAVLGCGVDVIYPTSNARLYYEIIERGGVISEFLPGTRPLREHFPIRNRIISGLSRGIVVVEAAARSGSTITANHALDQDRDVFAVPGRITDENSLGPNGMIQRGEAKPVFCAMDILCEYGIAANDIKEKPKVDITGLLPLEKQIVTELMKGEKSADELCEILSLPVAKVISCLTSLQFSGIIKQLPGRIFGI